MTGRVGPWTEPSGVGQRQAQVLRLVEREQRPAQPALQHPQEFALAAGHCVDASPELPGLPNTSPRLNSAVSPVPHLSTSHAINLT